MNKAELIATVAEKTGLSKKDSEKAVNATFDTITANLEVGEKVQLVGFGVFDIKERGSRTAATPRPRKRSRSRRRACPSSRPAKCSRTLFPNKRCKRSGPDPERFSQEDAYAPGQISESFAAHQAPHRGKRCL